MPRLKTEDSDFFSSPLGAYKREESSIGRKCWGALNGRAFEQPAGTCTVGVNYILIVEVDRPSKEKVFELQVRDPDPVNPVRTSGFRAERLPSLYP